MSGPVAQSRARPVAIRAIRRPERFTSTMTPNSCGVTPPYTAPAAALLRAGVWSWRGFAAATNGRQTSATTASTPARRIQRVLAVILRRRDATSSRLIGSSLRRHPGVRG
jgi:hypothetical protein